jgi:hypothetical protein
MPRRKKENDVNVQRRNELNMDERNPKPLIVVIAGLLSAIMSFFTPDEGLSASLFGVGVIMAGFCALYWLATPADPID